MSRFYIFFCLFCFFACNNDNTSGGFQSTSTEGQISNADLIRNPVSSEGTTDTINVAKFKFEALQYDFGTVKQGDVIKKTFEFSNAGAVPLLITDARSTCGCTVADYPETPILPGEGSKIVVEFDTKNKEGHQHKPVTLTANTYPSTTQLILKGKVEE